MKELDSLRNKNQSLVQNAGFLQNEIDKWKQQSLEHEQAKGNLKKDVDRLQNDLATSETEKEKLNGIMNLKQGEIEELRST